MILRLNQVPLAVFHAAPTTLTVSDFELKGGDDHLHPSNDNFVIHISTEPSVSINQNSPAEARVIVYASLQRAKPRNGVTELWAGLITEKLDRV